MNCAGQVGHGAPPRRHAAAHVSALLALSTRTVRLPLARTAVAQSPAKLDRCGEQERHHLAVRWRPRVALVRWQTRPAYRVADLQQEKRIDIPRGACLEN